MISKQNGIIVVSSLFSRHTHLDICKDAINSSLYFHTLGALKSRVLTPQDLTTRHQIKQIATG